MSAAWDDSPTPADPHPFADDRLYPPGTAIALAILFTIGILGGAGFALLIWWASP